MTTTIVFHLPVHRQTALKLADPGVTARQAYDRNIGGYIEFLRGEGQRAGFGVASDQRDDGPAFSIDEDDHRQKKAAHDWLETQPDIWNWMPRA